MPVTAPAIKKTGRAIRRKPVAPSPDPRQPAEPERPADHNGVPVEHEVLIQNLPRAPFRISKLVLADGTTAFACRDCLFTADSRGGVIVHRNNEHGSLTGRKRKTANHALKSTPDPVLAPREDGTPAPSNPLKWTLEEYLAIAPDLAALGDLIDRTETENERLRAEVQRLNLALRESSDKAAAFDAFQDELVTLRLTLQSQPDYDKIKAEVITLRAWKKNITKKLNAVGFQLNEED